MIESTGFPTTLLDFNRTLSNPLSEQDGANTMERYTLATHPEKPYQKSDNNRFWIETFEHKFAKQADKGQNSLGAEVVVGWVRCSLSYRKGLGLSVLFYSNLFTHHRFQRTTFHNLHAAFGLEAMSLERSFTSNFPVLHETATIVWLRLAAGGGQIELHVTKTPWSSSATDPALPNIINKRKYLKNYSALCVLPRQQTTLKGLEGEVWGLSPFSVQALFLLPDKDGQI